MPRYDAATSWPFIAPKPALTVANGAMNEPLGFLLPVNCTLVLSAKLYITRLAVTPVRDTLPFWNTAPLPRTLISTVEFAGALMLTVLDPVMSAALTENTFSVVLVPVRVRVLNCSELVPLAARPPQVVDRLR